MAQDLNNPPPPPPQRPNGLYNNGNSTGGSGNIGLGNSNPIGDWFKGAWQTFSGRNDYRAPENVFNPMAAYDGAASQQARTGQAAAYNNLGQPNSYYQGLMTGKSPSLAESQMRQGIAQAQRQGMQAASGAHGIDRAAAFRQAQNNSADLAARGAIAGGQQRLQEQQLGAQGYSQGLQAQSNMAGTARQQDIGEQQGLFGLQNQAQANLNQQYGINAGVTGSNAANQQKATGGLVQMVGALLASDVKNKEDIHSLRPGVTAEKPAASSPTAAALMNYGATGGSQTSNGGPMFDQQTLNNYASLTGATQAQQSDAGPWASMIPGGGGSSGAILSDEDSKEAFRGIHPYQFRYKDAFADDMARQEAAQAPPGDKSNAYAQAFYDAKAPRMGVMAQDLAANPETRSSVVETPKGLAIDGKRALGLLLASSADFNDRLSALESKKGRRAA
jgi:hypothetical protein